MATQPPSFPPNLPFGSLAIYPQKPHTTPLQLNAAAFIVRGVKRDAATAVGPHRSYIQIAIDKLVELMPGSLLDAFFEPDAVLVPLPGSTLSRANTVSAPRSIGLALVDAGLGARVLMCLRRVESISKSAFASSGQRPDAIQQYESMALEVPLHEPEPTNILLIDDVVTRGATAMGGAARLLTAFPNASIKLFALARTDPVNASFYDPCVGTITIQRNGLYLKRSNADPSTRSSGKLF